MLTNSQTSKMFTFIILIWGDGEAMQHINLIHLPNLMSNLNSFEISTQGVLFKASGNWNVYHFFENILDPFQSCVCKITFFWKADVLATHVEIPYKAPAMQMPNPPRVGCGPGRELCRRGVTEAPFTFQEQPPQSAGPQCSGESEDSDHPPLLYMVFLLEGDHFCLVDQKTDKDPVSVASSLTWGTFPPTKQHTEESL